MGCIPSEIRGQACLCYTVMDAVPGSRTEPAVLPRHIVNVSWNMAYNKKHIVVFLVDEREDKK